MASDFDKLFGDDWKPHDPESEGYLPLQGRGGQSGELNFDSLPHVPSEGETSEKENLTPRSLNEKEVKVMDVYMHQEQGMDAQHFVLLRDNKRRNVPIWVGKFEAYAISLALGGDAPDRPMTHDLIKIMVDRMGGTIERIVIDDLWNETFYAKISVVKADSTTMDIDARPSDAIALAIRAQAPIYMAESVLEATVRPE